MKSSDATPATPMTYTLAIPGKAAVLGGGWRLLLATAIARPGWP